MEEAEEQRQIVEEQKKKMKKEEEERKETLKEFLIQQTGGSIGGIAMKRTSSLMTSEERSPSKCQFQACCKVGTDGPHPISLKTLIPVKLSGIEGCPSCLKPFASLPRARLMKKCGHVVCDACFSELKMKKCLICEVSVIESEGDVVLLETEGTGFAAGGGIVETKRYDIAFQ